ncbi:hypothetical protein LAZ40_05520 [Cereibacter sphaeroides]|uniref:hypothetical protein n=1 Tax=Cereibacter sphaeroides TaxID=1063 RepID=UPI001F1A6C5A|nr:hypothetical protein [Cereibacter sphaeroides]MCE6958508.1 hypothetical protein [Cereibacter sphaeroides]MCE6972830.1 hypothetical protein [Cereibacter sphaeroides]
MFTTLIRTDFSAAAIARFETICRRHLRDGLDARDYASARAFAFAFDVEGDVSLTIPAQDSRSGEEHVMTFTNKDDFCWFDPDAAVGPSM